VPLAAIVMHLITQEISHYCDGYSDEFKCIKGERKGRLKWTSWMRMFWVNSFGNSPYHWLQA